MILILVGPSGSGKTAVAGKLMEKYGYIKVRTVTTRKRREKEPEDAYYFMSTDEFESHRKAGDFAEIDRYGDNYYGMLKADLEDGTKKINVMTLNGAGAVKKVFLMLISVNCQWV